MAAAANICAACTALLAPLFGTDSGYWRPLTIIYPIFMIVAGIWVYVDANERVGNGWLWGTIAFAVPPIGLPLYYILIALYGWQNSRQRSGPEQAGREQLERERKKLVMQGELERQKYLHDAEEHGGTLFNPAIGMGSKGQGFRHFTDARAEELIQERRYDEALAYLRDLYAVAREENDGRAADTYRSYIASLPGGRDLVKEL